MTQLFSILLPRTQKKGLSVQCIVQTSENVLSSHLSLAAFQSLEMSEAGD